MNALDILKETAKKFPEAPAQGRLVSVHEGKTCYCLLGRIGNVSGMSDAELTIGSTIGGDVYKDLRADSERFKAITALADEIIARHPEMTSYDYDPLTAVYSFNDHTLAVPGSPTPESVEEITEVVEAAALRLARAEAAHLRTKLAEIEDDLADDLFDDAHHDEEPPEEDTQPIGLILVPVSAAADPNATVIRSARIVTDGPSFVGDLVLEAVEAGLIPATEEACLVIHPTTAVMWRVNITQATTVVTDYSGIERVGSITEAKEA